MQQSKITLKMSCVHTCSSCESFFIVLMLERINLLGHILPFSISDMLNYIVFTSNGRYVCPAVYLSSRVTQILMFRVKIGLIGSYCLGTSSCSCETLPGTSVSEYANISMLVFAYSETAKTNDGNFLLVLGT